MLLLLPISALLWFMKELLDLLSMPNNVLSERHEAETSLKVRISCTYMYVSTALTILFSPLFAAGSSSSEFLRPEEDELATAL